MPEVARGLNGVGQVLAALLLSAVLYIDVARTPVLARRTREAVRERRPDARLRLYRLIVSSGWAVALLAVGVLRTGSLSWSRIGFAAADLRPVSSVLFGLLGGLVVSVALARYRRTPMSVIGDIELLIPGNRRERRWFVASAVTAGITEEVTYRALPLALVTALLPTADRLFAVLIVAMGFGLAHRYQGWPGMLGTAALGCLLGWLYVTSGSVWPGMLVHVVIDLRLLLVAAPAVQRSA